MNTPMAFPIPISPSGLFDIGWNNLQNLPPSKSFENSNSVTAQLAKIQHKVHKTSKVLSDMNSKLGGVYELEQKYMSERLRTKEIENDSYEKSLRERLRSKEIMNDELELQMHNDQRQLRLSEARLNEEKRQIELNHYKRKLEAEEEASRKKLELDLNVRKAHEITVFTDNEAHKREIEKNESFSIMPISIATCYQ